MEEEIFEALKSKAREMERFYENNKYFIEAGRINQEIKTFMEKYPEGCDSQDFFKFLNSRR